MTDEQNKRDENSACGCGGGSGCSGAGKWIWIALLLAVAGVLIAKNAGKKPAADFPSARESEAPEALGAAAVPQGAALPRLVDLGSTKCIPCRMMAPILEELKQTYAGKLRVEFIDVWEHPEKGREYGVKMIPTQIFYDAEGKERFRHEGLLPKDDILAKWRELGVDLQAEQTGGSHDAKGP